LPAVGLSQLTSYWDLPQFLHDFMVDGHSTLYYPSITPSKNSSTSSTNSNAKKCKTVSTEVKMVLPSLRCKSLGGNTAICWPCAWHSRWRLWLSWQGMQLKACLKYLSSHQLLHQNTKGEEVEGNAVDLGSSFIYIHIKETSPLFEIISQYHTY